MKKLLTVLSVLTVAVAFLVTACDSPPSSPSSRPSYSQDGAEEKVAEKAWPFNLEEELGSAQALMTAEGLTARNFVVIFDDSGSMGGEKIRVAKEAVAEWSKTVPEGANLGLVTFHGGSWSLQPFTADKKKDFIKFVDDVDANGGTPLGGTIEYAFVMLTKQGLRQLGYGEYTIVVVTDGDATDGYKMDRVVKYVLDTSPVQFFNIGFHIGTKHALNQPGRMIYRTADNPAELRKGLQEVLAEAESFDVSDFE